MSDYEIGYQKPPKEAQFKPGASGNPNGRPKGSKNIRTVLDDELNIKVTVTENGCKSEISKMEALIKSLVATALGGDDKARSALIALMIKVYGSDLTATKEVERIISNDNDKQILERFMSRFSKIEEEKCSTQN